MPMPLEESFNEGEDLLEILKGEVLELIREFEKTDESIEDMKTILSIWKNPIEKQAERLGGITEKKINRFLDICDDYANNRGMIERVRQEAEEIRIQLDL